MKRRNELEGKTKGARMIKGLFLGFSITFILIIFAVPTINFVAKDREFSENENRYLAKFPTFSISNILDASFMENFEEYFTDQFFARDFMLKVKTKIDLILGKKEVNGVIIGEDDYLFEKQEDFDTQKVAQMASDITAFSNKYPKINQAFVLSPNSIWLNQEKLPTGISINSQTEQLKNFSEGIAKSQLKFVDVETSFNKIKGEHQLFYKTDHHWTTRSAFEIFCNLMDTWKIKFDKENFEFSTVSNEFQGTLSSKTGITDAMDTIEICTPKNSSATYTVNYKQEQVLKTSLFALDKLETKNQYEVFLNGNFAEIEIKTTSKSFNTLLILKDSYANCLIPMLTPYFSKIVVVDPRYYTENISNLMQENNFSHMLFAYNLSTFASDNSLQDVIAVG